MSHLDWFRFRDPKISMGLSNRIPISLPGSFFIPPTFLANFTKMNCGSGALIWPPVKRQGFSVQARRRRSKCQISTTNRWMAKKNDVFFGMVPEVRGSQTRYVLKKRLQKRHERFPGISWGGWFWSIPNGWCVIHLCCFKVQKRGD